MYLDKQHPRPVYLQLKEMLRGQIEHGHYLSHQQLPSERDLSQHHNLSRMTARKALKALIAEGFAYTRAGKGTFVSDLSCKMCKDTPQLVGGSSFGAQVTHPYFRQKLLDPLLSFDCVGIEQGINEVLAAHSLETVASKLFPEIIRHLEQQWVAKKVSLPAYNYAITTLRSQLISMVNATAMPKTGPKILLGCAPGDLHEIGLLLLALSLRRRGYLVIYMGPSFAPGEFNQVINTARPQLICLSAATEQSVNSLHFLSSQYANKTKGIQLHQRSLLTFGGVFFNKNPELVSKIPAIYLGSSIEKSRG